MSEPPQLGDSSVGIGGHLSGVSMRCRPTDVPVSLFTYIMARRGGKAQSSRF